MVGGSVEIQQSALTGVINAVDRRVSEVRMIACPATSQTAWTIEAPAFSLSASLPCTNTNLPNFVHHRNAAHLRSYTDASLTLSLTLLFHTLASQPFGRTELSVPGQWQLVYNQS